MGGGFVANFEVLLSDLSPFAVEGKLESGSGFYGGVEAAVDGPIHHRLGRHFTLGLDFRIGG